MTVLSKCESDVMNSADDGDAMIKLTEYFKQVIKVSIYDDDDENRGNYYFFCILIQRELNRWSQFSEQKLRFFSKVLQRAFFQKSEN